MLQKVRIQTWGAVPGNGLVATARLLRNVQGNESQSMSFEWKACGFSTAVDCKMLKTFEDPRLFIEIK